ncbi:MAG: Zn-dependent hydrolase, RNA-metabolising [uncultured Campylobacterales bacterium]|uniref:Ribonuclease J n=1 Tax=uncultured Campylobacterales bacterium TaxID=352960 RepID=A0A6S6SZD9_9BACT|nr:MAG: Zn-dependent hydrolase, RNA-metabolising [uncultured Campylobacterales bacterium]
MQNNRYRRNKVNVFQGEWFEKVKKSIQSNEAIHRRTLLSHNKLNTETDIKVKITPIGGLGEIGGNMTVIETDKTAIVIDVGINFPDETMHGVDILIPDFSYLHKIRSKLKAIIITHGHEDHIGALPYLFKEIKIPIYATPLPLGMIAHKFEEHGLSRDVSYFRPISKRKVYDIAGFKIEWIHMTHSIIDCSSLAIDAGSGTIFHTGDFKIDHTPVDGYPTDLGRIAYYAEKGILCLLSDSTNSHKPGSTKSEKSVGPVLDKIFAKTKGRIILSTFSSNVHRLYQAIESAQKYNRKICVIGRSMERNLEIARELNYIKVDKNIFIETHEIEKYTDDNILILTTGSQGEPMSALFRMAINEHRHIKIKKGDQVIISAKAIPGNEGSVSTVLNYLLKAGADVAYQDYPDIHTSGHAAQEEQKLLLRIAKPKFFLPIHGEHNHILKHKQTAVECGVEEKNIYLMDHGETIEVHPKYIKKVGSVKSGKVFIDNRANRRIENKVIYQRQQIASDGLITIIASINERKLLKTPKVESYGLIGDRDIGYFTKEFEGLISLLLANESNKFNNNTDIEREIYKSVKKYMLRKLSKYPTISVTVV